MVRLALPLGSFAVVALLPSALAGYTILDDYTANNYQDFFNKFSYWTDDDTTSGYVNYVSQSDAWNAGLLANNNGNIYIGVDHTNKASGRGRSSVRLTSTAVYSHNSLFVLDLTHMPGGVCGTWPAFWTTSATSHWPQEGEIDIIEQSNQNQHNQMSLHVSKQQGDCEISKSAAMKATQDRWGDCNQEDNQGCDANDPLLHSFGSVFNRDNGGVYAMEWTPYHVRVYFWPRDQIPSGAGGPLGSSPDPTTWGTPTTSFEGGGCNFDAHIKNQRIVINTDFCGDFAAGTWGQTCKAATGYSTCQSYVQNNPSAFSEAYWAINSLKVFNRKDCEYNC